MKTVELANIDLTSYIRAGDAVMWGQAAAEPLALTRALMQQRDRLGPIEVFIGAIMVTPLMDALGETLARFAGRDPLVVPLDDLQWADELTLDFLAWLAAEPRDYTDVMEAWRTSCPRLTVWEDAIDADLITRIHAPGQPVRITLTSRGEALLATRTLRLLGPARSAYGRLRSIIR